MAGYRVTLGRDLSFTPPSAGDQSRGIVRLSDDLANMRANLWRMPAGSRGRRHFEKIQEELFVVLNGRPTLRLGEPPEEVQLDTGSVAIVQPSTPVQLIDNGDFDALVLIVGAPPDVGQAEYLPD